MLLFSLVPALGCPGGSEVGPARPDAPIGPAAPAIALDGPKPTNVLILSVDTLRTDHINYFGYTERLTTPTIDRFFQDGLSFDNNYSCSSWTFPSLLCLLTGRDQVSLGFWPDNTTSSGEPGRAPDSITFMAEYFRDRGYHTMLSSGSGFLGGSGANTAQGFDVGSGAFDIPADALVDTALGYLSDHLSGDPDTPWMLHLHLLEPHAPYPVPEAYLDGADALPPIDYDMGTKDGVVGLWKDFPLLDEEAQAAGLENLSFYYDASIRFADSELARFLDEAGALGALDDTLIVFFSDHGEELWDHGNFNHGSTAYEEVLRAPVAFYMPDRLRPYTLDALSAHEDVMPTLFVIMGWEIPSNFTGFAAGVGNRGHTFALNYRREKTIQAVTDGRSKLIYRWGEAVNIGAGEGGGISGSEEQKLFFDLSDDPEEQRNIYDPEDSAVRDWWALLLPEVERLATWEADIAPENPGP